MAAEALAVSSVTPRRELPALFWAIVALACLLPLPIGAVYQWSWGLMACVVAIVLAVWSGRVLLGLQEPRFGFSALWVPLSLFGAVCVWVVVQALPFTPAAWHHPLWRSAAEALGAGAVEGRAAISLDPDATLSGLVRLLAYAGIFWISVQYCRRSARARQVLVAVVYASAAYALYGFVLYMFGSETILIFRKVAYVSDVTSTFVNRNSFATYAGIGLVCASGLLLVVLTQALAEGTDRRQRLTRLIEVMVGQGWPLLVAWILLSLTLILSHSRGGFLSTLIGLLTLVVTAGFTRAINRGLAIGVGCLCAAGLVATLGIGGGPLLERLQQTNVAIEERPLVYERTLSAIQDSGVFGTGLGTFEQAFRFYRTSNISGTFDMAHNSYLENALELGLPAAVALFGVVLWFAVICAMGVRRRRRDAVYPCVGLAATVLVAAHALTDFSLQIPAITATYVLLMGAASAQSWSSRSSAGGW